MLKSVVKIFGGDPNKRAIEENIETVDQINALEEAYEALSNEQLRAKTDEFKRRLAEGETLEDILVEAFAAVREASKRQLGLRHYDVQLIGGIVLHEGKVAEMRTGEGKTLVATLPIYLNALGGQGVHLVTVNDYLARRDARWMAPIYDLLGLSVGVLQMASRTEYGKKAFLVDLEKESSQEDQHQLVMVPRKEAYAADITYGTNNEFGFDYLRDNMAMRLEDRVQRRHHYAIVDEVDNVLIDEARTPLIISGPAHDDTENYLRMAQLVKQLKPTDYEINERDRSVALTELGEANVERLLGEPLRDPERPEDITPEQARLLGFLEQALRAQLLFKRNKDYLVQGGKVIIIDEHTGRLMPGRRWSDGLHQAVEAKEGVKVESENITYATITIQNYFRMYEKLAGMTGTALTEGEEFDKIYKLDALGIPPNVEYNATRKDAPLVSQQATEEETGYKYTYYAWREDGEQTPVFWKRKDYPDVVYRTEEAKFRALVREIVRVHVIGRPILVGTTSVENSERLSSRLRAEPVRRLLQTLLLRDAWFEKNEKEEDGRMVMELSYLNEPLERLPIADMRKMARDLDLSLNLESDKNVQKLLSILGLQPENTERLLEVIKAGVPQQVLNARKHTEESQIIAGAGAFGAVTIATNMAGRGVDIKLGGELAEEVLTNVNRVLNRAGYENAFDMTYEERYEALKKLERDAYGIYESEVNFFLQHMDEAAKVKELGGLHVIGSERHSARRIDNQLRGRSARQGDPGSSRFYLSMEDELMRLFGGQQMDNMMQRLNWDEEFPLDLGLVSRIIEGSQTRVEGANFDVRKHILEYDDVLNTQRATVYGQRDRIFVKDDLSEDVREMLEAELLARVPTALGDAEGPWRLLAWLEQIQPTFVRGDTLIPSFTFKLLLDYLKERNPKNPEEALRALLDVARKSLEAQEEHTLNSIASLTEAVQARLEEQINERLEVVDTFIEGLSLADETDTRGPRELADELSGLVRIPLSLSKDEQALLRDDPQQAAEIVSNQVESALVSQTVSRLVGSAERRVEESLDLALSELTGADWETISERILSAVEQDFENRKNTLIGENGDGQIGRDLRTQLEKMNGSVNERTLLNLLLTMPQGARATFDKRTHQRIIQRTTRLIYAYFAGQLIQDHSTEEITDMVLEHLEEARKASQYAWGLNQWARLAKATVGDLSARGRKGFLQALGFEDSPQISSKTLESLVDGKQEVAIKELGRQTLTEIYRELLLRVISELWVDYLTRIEALRVSVGLEAYAQRDPLVQYKAEASQMYQQLFLDIRNGVVTRMFTYQPRAATTAQASESQSEPEEIEAGEEEAEGPEIEVEAAGQVEEREPAQSPAESGGKRKRRRRH